ncbi:hypothetical protein CMK11_19740 [Candidatus Poribacteria bacterium]|nr:hypothetical protein [Candidatus Poribacteria bacterium]
MRAFRRMAAVWTIVTCLAPAWLAAADDAPSNDARIAYIEQRPRATRDGLASFLRLSRDRYQPKTNEYEVFTFDIYTVRPDGSGRRRVTEDGMSRMPRWSWNGEWLAYVSGPPPVRDLVVARADGSDARALLRDEQDILDFWWSHDSRRLLVTIEERRGNDLLEGRVIDTETGKVSRLSRAEWQMGWNHWEPGEPEVVNPRPRLTGTLSDVTWPVWSPDARLIAFTRDGLLAIADADAVSNSGRWFLFKDEPPADEAITWSRDGSKLLFRIEGFLAVAELDKDRWGDVRALSTRRVLHASRRGAGTFNADGTRVVFSSSPAGKRNHELFVIDVTGENERRITSSAADLQEPRWRPVFDADSANDQGDGR